MATLTVRGISLFVILAAATIGVMTRLEGSNVEVVSPISFNSVPSGQPLTGNADWVVIDSAVTEPVSGLQLKVARCNNPVFAFPIWIMSVVEPQIVEQAFDSGDYQMIDVYRGQSFASASRLFRIMSFLAARASQFWSNERTIYVNYFVRMAIPKDCAGQGLAYGEWAAAVLSLTKFVR
jgi:hypothetical protein